MQRTVKKKHRKVGKVYRKRKKLIRLKRTARKTYKANR